MLRTQRQERVGPLLSYARLATPLVEDGREEQGLRQGIGVREPLGLGEGCLVSLPCLLRIPQHPQTQSAKEAAGDARVLAVAQGMGAHLLRVIQGQPVLRVGIRKPQLSIKRQGIPQRAVGLQRQQGVVELFG
jgi:hypothetical protein